MIKTKHKKKDKNKKININTDIKPEKHKRIDNLNYYSEEIVKEIIEKIISLSITKIFSNKFEKVLPDFCVTSIKRIIDNLIQMLYINCDNDDIYYSFNLKYNKKYAKSDEKRYKYIRHIKVSKNKKKLAELELLSLIKKNKHLKKEMIIKDMHIHDYLSSSFEQPKNIYIKSPKKMNYDKKIDKLNNWEFISQPKSFGQHRIATHSNITSLLNQSSNQQKIEEKKIKPKSKFYTPFNFSKKSIKHSDKNSKIEEIPIKKKLYTILKMNSLKEIEEGKNSNANETPEIIELRKNKIEELIKLKEENDLKKQKLKENMKLDKSININNITLNLIEKKKKNISIKEQKRYIEEQMHKGNFTTDIEGNIVIVNEIKPDKLIEDLPIAYSKFKGIHIDNDDNKIEQGNNIFSKKRNNSIFLYNNLKKKSLIFNDKCQNVSMPEYLSDRIKPSGSNFDLIKPETGVIVYEKTKSKSGGNKFYEKYNKISMYDFNQTLKQTLDNEKKSIHFKAINSLNKTIDLKNSNIFIDKLKNINNNISEKNNQKKLFDKTFTNELKNNKQLNSKNLNKSQSEILLKIKKYSLLGDMIIPEDTDKDSNIQKFMEDNINENIRLNQRNLFLKHIKRINNNTFKNSFSYRLMDSFNKSIVLGSKNTSGFENYIGLPNKKKFPIIPLKRNKSNLLIEKNTYATKINIRRTRIKNNINKDYKEMNYK